MEKKEVDALHSIIEFTRAKRNKEEAKNDKFEQDIIDEIDRRNKMEKIGTKITKRMMHF